MSVETDGTLREPVQVRRVELPRSIGAQEMPIQTVEQDDHGAARRGTRCLGHRGILSRSNGGKAMARKLSHLSALFLFLSAGAARAEVQAGDVITAANK